MSGSPKWWRVRTVLVVALALLASHCSTKGVDGSTHFVRCASDSDCSSGEVCGQKRYCVDRAAPEDGGEASVTPSTWVTGLIAAYCAQAVRCGQFPDSAVCDAFMGPQIAVDNFNSPTAAITAVVGRKAQFDSAKAASCLAAFSEMDCDLASSNLASVPVACTSVFSGSVSDGGTCIDDVECATGSMCVIASTTTCEGTCTPANGGPCRTNGDCLPRQYCAGVPWQGPGVWGSGVCADAVPPGNTEGAPCGTPVPCAQGLSCFGGPAPARCGVAVGEEGAPCRLLGAPGPTCASDLVCVISHDGMTGSCMPPAKRGETCTSLLQCDAEYSFARTICDENGSHTCVPRPSKGACTVVNGVNTCDPVISYCDAGTCKPWLPEGSPCTFPTSNGLDPCGRWSSCQGGVCTSTLAPACTPK
jgi:hypothetical protein